MRLSKFAVLFSVVSATCIDSAHAEDKSPLRTPTYRERGMVSSVPFAKIEPTEIWKNFLKKNGKTIKFSLKQGEPVQYKPVRCEQQINADGGICTVPFPVTQVTRKIGIGSGYLECAMALPEVIFATGKKRIQGESEEDDVVVDYPIKWQLDSYPKIIVGDSFAIKSMSIKKVEVLNNYPGDDKPGTPDEILKPTTAVPWDSLKFYKHPKKVKAFHYAVHLSITKDDDNTEDCVPVDPVVVNRD